MSHKRVSESDQPPTKRQDRVNRRSETPVPPPKPRVRIEHRSMHELAVARRERLQMLSYVPNDVLAHVRNYVCPPNSVAACDWQAYAPIFGMLGSPFSDLLLRDDVVVLIADLVDDDRVPGLKLLRDLHRHARPEVCNALCTNALAALGKSVYRMFTRALFKAVLCPWRINGELEKCTRKERIAACLAVTDKSDADMAKAVAMGKPNQALDVALRIQLWQEADRLTRSPYNQVASFGQIDKLRQNSTASRQAPLELVCRLIDINRHEVAHDMLHRALIRADRVIFDYTLNTCSEHINVDDIFSYFGKESDAFRPHSDANNNVRVEMVHSLMDRLSLSQIERLRFAALVLCDQRYPSALLDILLAKPYCHLILCRFAARFGNLSAVRLYLPEVQNRNEILCILQAYAPSNEDQLYTDLEVLDALEIPPDLANEAQLLDNAIISMIRMHGTEAYRFARQMGLRLQSYQHVLFHAMKHGMYNLAGMIIRESEIDSTTLIRMVVSVAQSADDPNFDVDIRPALESGVISAPELLISVCDDIARTNSPCRNPVMDQISTYYRCKITK